jgi:hypothetical protein
MVGAGEMQLQVCVVLTGQGCMHTCPPASPPCNLCPHCNPSDSVAHWKVALDAGLDVAAIQLALQQGNTQSLGEHHSLASTAGAGQPGQHFAHQDLAAGCKRRRKSNGSDMAGVTTYMFMMRM